MHLFADKHLAKRVWEVRESSLGVISYVPGEALTWEGWEDSAVSPEKLGQLSSRPAQADGPVRLPWHAVRPLWRRMRAQSHEFRSRRPAKASPTIASSWKKPPTSWSAYGGSLSGEHGDGQARAELLPKMFGPELVEAFREFKTIWDPDWKMNPGKVVEPNRLDENLRLGAGYQPWDPPTHFRFPAGPGQPDPCHLALRRSGKVPP